MMDVVRRPSVKMDLRPIVEGEETSIKLPSIHNTAHMMASEASNSRRSSKETGGSRRSSNFIGVSIALTRRGSQVRRGSIRNRVEIAASEKPEQLAALVPMPQSPRLTSSMSVEAQYSILKCYEDRLRRQLASVYPDYAGLLNRSQTPRNGRIHLRDPDNPDQPTGDENEDTSSAGEDVVDGARSTRSLPPPSHHTSQHHMNHPLSARVHSSWNVKVPHHRQLALSRRLQMAQSLIDTFADATCAVTSMPSCRPSKSDFNAIQGYNWWSSGWQEEFQINEPSVIS